MYPSNLSSHWLGKINREEGRPFVFYLHPWELDPDQPRLPGSMKSRFRHYQNLSSTQTKLERLLAAFKFGTLSESIAAYETELDSPVGRRMTIQELSSVNIR